MRTDRPRLWLEFDWTGTFDPTAWLASADAIRFIASLVPGGWAEVMQRNHSLALRARRILSATLDIAPPAPDEMLGSMATLPIRDARPGEPAGDADPLHLLLFEHHHIEVPIMPWPQWPKRLLRVSAHLYNDESEYAELGRILRALG